MKCLVGRSACRLQGSSANKRAYAPSAFPALAARAVPALTEAKACSCPPKPQGHVEEKLRLLFVPETPMCGGLQSLGDERALDRLCRLSFDREG